jgi:hypothetical protein
MSQHPSIPSTAIAKRIKKSSWTTASSSFLKAQKWTRNGGQKGPDSSQKVLNAEKVARREAKRMVSFMFNFHFGGNVKNCESE